MHQCYSQKVAAAPGACLGSLALICLLMSMQVACNGDCSMRACSFGHWFCEGWRFVHAVAVRSGKFNICVWCVGKDMDVVVCLMRCDCVVEASREPAADMIHEYWQLHHVLYHCRLADIRHLQASCLDGGLHFLWEGAYLTGRPVGGK
jgi:hypothetical protein